MRPLLRSALALFLLLPLAASAEVLVSGGRISFNNLGGGSTFRARAQVYTIIDPDAGSVAVITYYKAGRIARFYNVREYGDATITKVDAGQGRIATAMHLAQSDSDEMGNTFVVSFYARGFDKILQISDGATASFPKTATGTARISGTDVSGAPFLSEQAVSLSFDQALTIASNNAGHDFETAVRAVIGSLESRGYVRDDL